MEEPSSWITQRTRLPPCVWRWVLFAGILIAATASASAETAWDVLKQFGYVGTWAGACNRPATRLNFFETIFKDERGNARRAADRGPSIPIALGFVDYAKIVSPTTIKVRIRNADPNWGALDGFSYDTIFIKENIPGSEEVDRIRGLESIQSDGKVIAKNGILVLYGKMPTSWVYRCQPTS